MWKWLNKLYRGTSYLLFFLILLGAFYKFLSFFIFRGPVPIPIDALIVGFSLPFLKNYHPYDLPDWTRGK